MIRKFIISLAASLMVSGPALAQDDIDAALSHRVIAGWQQADGSYIAGLELTLAPGWKTYWRSPGDAGIPPSFDWSRARNLQDAHVHWPTPEVFWQSGMRSVGYETRVVLPVSLTPKRQGQDIRLRGRMDLGICSDICVPTSLEIDQVLSTNANNRIPALVAAMAALPYSAQEAGLRSATCALSPTTDGMAVEVTVDMPSAGGREDSVVEAPDPGIWVSDAKTHRAGRTLTISAEMVATTQAPLLIDRSRLRITVIGQSHAVDIQGCTG